MTVTREEATALLVGVHAVLNAESLPALSYGLCYLLAQDSVLDRLPIAVTRKPGTVYMVLERMFGEEIPYYRDPKCPPEWQRGVWSEERMTLLCMLGALSADDIVEMCQ